MEKLVSLESVDAGYGDKTIIKNVNLEIFQNDFLGVIGPNGAGKTTLLKVILGLLHPFKGEVKYYEKSKEVRNITIGYLPQINTIDRKFPISVDEVILSGIMSERLSFFRKGKPEKQKIYEIAEMLGIKHLLNQPVGELSGGQLQRVFLCRAIISSPKVLILDEPSTYVDSKFETELYDILDRLNEKMAIIMVTHDVGTISSYVKTIACVNHTLHYHPGNKISDEILKMYDCPIDLITHGKIPHRVLGSHEH